MADSNPIQGQCLQARVERPQRVVFCLTELGLNLSQGFLAPKISIMFYGKWNVLETDASTFDIA